MERYPALYSDSYGSIDTVLYNDYSTLYFDVNGVKFTGRAFDDFTPSPDLTPDQLVRFTLHDIEISGSDPKEYAHELRCFSLQFEVQVSFFDQQDKEHITGLSLNISISSSGYPSIFADIEVNGNVVVSKSVGFEGVLEQLEKKCKIRFRNCFGCLFSDYWVAGNQLFGDMMCFKGAKKEYLAAKGKSDFMEIAHLNSGRVQETYYCEEYQQRRPGIGYRGWPIRNFYHDPDFRTHPHRSFRKGCRSLVMLLQQSVRNKGNVPQRKLYTGANTR